MAWRLFAVPVIGTGSSRFDPRRPKYVAAGSVSGDIGLYDTARTITNASNAGPIVVTSAAHTLTDDQVVRVTDVIGNTAANGIWNITINNANSFSLTGSLGNGTYVSGGLAQPWLRWAMQDYGRSPWCLMAADVSAVQLAFLTAQVDVAVIPAAINNQIGGANVQAVRDYLEAARIPGNWATGSTTWQALVRTVGGLFQFAQRFQGISGGQELLPVGIGLNDNYGSLSEEWKAWFIQTTQSFGYDTTGLTDQTSIRTILKALADAWGNQVFILGDLTF